MRAESRDHAGRDAEDEPRWRGPRRGERERARAPVREEAGRASESRAQRRASRDDARKRHRPLMDRACGPAPELRVHRFQSTCGVNRDFSLDSLSMNDNRPLGRGGGGASRLSLALRPRRRVPSVSPPRPAPRIPRDAGLYVNVLIRSESNPRGRPGAGKGCSRKTAFTWRLEILGVDLPVVVESAT